MRKDAWNKKKEIFEIINLKTQSLIKSSSDLMMNMEQILSECMIKFKEIVDINSLALFNELNNRMENIYKQINSSKEVLDEEMCRINKVQVMRRNSINGQIDSNKDVMDEVKKMLRDLMQKIDNNVGRSEANSIMLNQNIEQNTREVRSLMHVTNQLQLDIDNLNNIVIELQKKVQENNVKIENRSGGEFRKEKSNEQKSQNKKGKSKKKDERSDSDGESNGPHRPKALSEENYQDKNIIKILKNDNKFMLWDDWHMISNVDWTMLTNMLWVFIRNCNQHESKNKEAAYEYIQDLKKVQSY
jgi:hypothetical protein